MKALELLRSGDIEQALVELQNEVRRNPADFKNRVFLFQMLVVTGQWERALTQLNLTGELDAIALAMVQTYREALRCEVFRQQVFAGKRLPLVFGQPQEWVAHLLESFRLLTDGKFAESQKLRDMAFQAAPARSGTITVGKATGDGKSGEGKGGEGQSSDAEQKGEPFQWIADADPRLGPMLEAIINGRYYWVPLETVRELTIDPPADLRDVVWMPAHFEWINGGETVALLPTRYAGSESSPDPLIRLARKTEWNEAAPELFVGLGQRMLAGDAGDYPLMEIRKIVFDEDIQADGPAAAAEAVDG
jgi:type VI secretion system protein ImpE